MGCYGVGISRLLQAVIEHGCDITGSGNRLVWPLSIAPYLTYIVPLTMSEVRWSIVDVYNAVCTYVFAFLLPGIVCIVYIVMCRLSFKHCFLRLPTSFLSFLPSFSLSLGSLVSLTPGSN